MLLKDWDDLPDRMQNDSVRKYYEILNKKKKSLILKRIFDILIGLLTLIVLSPLLLVISIAVKLDSEGPVYFRQVRITQYGKQFRIFKFRSMVNDAELKGSSVTTNNDSRITRTGQFLRKYRLDEIPQLFNIISGDMSFVGTRPEVPKYVEHYTDEMLATLLLPAGVTSESSIKYKDEDLLLVNADDVDEIYINKVLPEKMKLNLINLGQFGLLSDIRTIFQTVISMLNNKK
jgi:lipopolysaccharide/colanic/teichoic acid biosynthesis glycosyltransferase